MTKEHAAAAVAAKVDVINIYGPPPGMATSRPKASSALITRMYFPRSNIPRHSRRTPCIGYSPSAALIADLANKYSQVVTINLSGQKDSYCRAGDRLKRRSTSMFRWRGSMEAMSLGATGLLSAEASVLPKTCRNHGCVREADLAEAGKYYSQIVRMNKYVAKWHGGSPRWLKTTMKLLKIPGGEGGVRL